MSSEPFETMHLAPDLKRPAGDAAHYLVVVEGDRPGYQKELPRLLTIGRDTSCRIRIQDLGVSRVHCRLRLEGDQLVVEDTNSRNGTFVEGERIQGPRELRVGSLLQVGNHVFRHEVRSREDVARAAELGRDLERARSYVAALIPAPVETGAVRTRWVFEPSAELAGDLFGYHELDEDRLALYLLDVCGHGVGSAMHSASVLNAIRNQTLPGADFSCPGQVLGALDRSFPMESHGNLYFTLWYGVFDRSEWRLRFSSAGHPPALLWSAEKGELQRLATPNPPIGVLGAGEFAEAEVTPGERSRLYVFSDGAYEIKLAGGDLWTLEGFERLVAEGAGAEEGEAERLRGEILARSGSPSLDDDLSLLIASFGPAPA